MPERSEAKAMMPQDRFCLTIDCIHTCPCHIEFAAARRKNWMRVDWEWMLFLGMSSCIRYLMLDKDSLQHASAASLS